ncbi:MAG: PilZ domain-containing protein, partial [Gammaproteobacteria bacterium]|nr:PilZ domain-containing protein [Gammaproteobacteria bacterium]
MDRRTSPRMPIRLAAQLQIRPFGSWPCQISDVCAEGLFIRVSDVVEQQWRIKGAARQDQDLRVVFRDPADGQLHGLAARIARRIEGALGVFFT